jgi:hypothetical protein
MGRLWFDGGPLHAGAPAGAPASSIPPTITWCQWTAKCSAAAAKPPACSACSRRRRRARRACRAPSGPRGRRLFRSPHRLHGRPRLRSSLPPRLPRRVEARGTVGLRRVVGQVPGPPAPEVERRTGLRPLLNSFHQAGIPGSPTLPEWWLVRPGMRFASRALVFLTKRVDSLGGLCGARGVRAWFAIAGHAEISHDSQRAERGAARTVATPSGSPPWPRRFRARGVRSPTACHSGRRRRRPGRSGRGR